jgi:hypothetical protein
LKIDPVGRSGINGQAGPERKRELDMSLRDQSGASRAGVILRERLDARAARRLDESASEWVLDQAADRLLNALMGEDDPGTIEVTIEVCEVGQAVGV